MTNDLLTLQNQLHALRVAYKEADNDAAKEKIETEGAIVNCRIKALLIAKDIRENGKRITV